MLISRHKPRIDELGPLIGVIKLYVMRPFILCSDTQQNHRTMLSYSCVFDTPPVWDSLYDESTRSSSIFRSIVSSSVFKKAGMLFKEEIIESILDLYEAFSKMDQLSDASDATIIAQTEHVLALARNETLSHFLETRKAAVDNISRVNACCQLCCLIFWDLLRLRLLRVNISTINENVKRLQELMANIDYSFWIRRAPEVFTWITFTGAAGCIDANDRGAFIHRGSTILTAVDSESLTLMTQGWKYFCLLRRASGLSTS